MKNLIVNADDFGLTPSVNLGIIESFKNGIVTSTTLMVNQPFAEHACKLAHENQRLDIGLHITFDKGRALSGVSSLTDREGNLLPDDKLMTDACEEDFYKEIEAQLRYFNVIMKRNPTHLDSHHHIHIRNPKANKAFMKIINKYGLKYRNNDNFIGDFYDDGVTRKNLIDLIEKKLSEGFETVELMCHPAYIDSYLEETTSYLHKRRDELEVLTSIDIKNHIKSNYHLISYADLSSDS